MCKNTGSFDDWIIMQFVWISILNVQECRLFVVSLVKNNIITEVPSINCIVYNKERSAHESAFKIHCYSLLYSASDFVLLEHIEKWYRPHLLLHNLHTHCSLDSWKPTVRHSLWWNPCTESRVIALRIFLLGPSQSLFNIASVE